MPSEVVIKLNDLQLAGTTFAALLGLAFGSFLNVVVSRLPEDESVVAPRSHCRHCSHILSWWENIPILSWIILRGRCRSCKTPISLRYPLIELTMAGIWVAIWLKYGQTLFVFPPTSNGAALPFALTLTLLCGYLVFSWLLVALASLDAENFWLPDILTLPGIALGLAFALLVAWTGSVGHASAMHFEFVDPLWARTLEALVAAGIILLIRLAYWLVRRREGMGLGDAKLMAMLGAWLGLLGAVESFTIAILGATAAALVWIILLAIRRKMHEWARMPLPFGTFLCLAAISEIFYPGWFWTWWSRTFLFL